MARPDRSLRALARQESERDHVFQAWSREYDRAPPECRWTKELVKERMREAQRVYRVTTGRIGPREYGQCLPDPLKDDLDRWYTQMAEADQREKDAQEQNRTRFAPTVEQVSRADGALCFQSRYLVGTPFDKGPKEGPLAMLNLFLAGGGWEAGFKARGIAATTAYRHRDHALYIIAIGLMRDGVPTGEDLSPPAESAGPVALPEWWWQVDLLMHDMTEPVERRLTMADILIESQVKAHEYEARSLTKKETYAAYRGRCVVLQRLLREREKIEGVLA